MHGSSVRSGRMDRSRFHGRPAGPAAAAATCCRAMSICHGSAGVKESRPRRCQLSIGMHACMARGLLSAQLAGQRQLRTTNAERERIARFFLVTRSCARARANTNSGKWPGGPTRPGGRRACDHARPAERTRPPRIDRRCKLAFASLIKALGTACLMTCMHGCFCDACMRARAGAGGSRQYVSFLGSRITMIYSSDELVSDGVTMLRCSSTHTPVADF